jgi:hypothetical protein
MASMFEQYCWLKSIKPVPASPYAVANFVRDVSAAGIDQIWPAVQEIARAHYTIGLADPTLSECVTAELNKIAGINPPRSWDREHRSLFTRLPYDLQVYISKREDERDKEVRRAQNQLDKLRKEPKDASNQTTASAA